MVIEFVSDAEFTIVVEHSNRHQTREGQPMSFIALLVGDTENNLIVHSEDMCVHIGSGTAIIESNSKKHGWQDGAITMTHYA